MTMKELGMPALRLPRLALAMTLVLSAMGLGACESSAGKGAAIGAAGGAAAGLITGENCSAAPAVPGRGRRLPRHAD